MLSIITAAVAEAHGDPEEFELDDHWFEMARPTGDLFPNAHEQSVKRRADLGLIIRRPCRSSLTGRSSAASNPRPARTATPEEPHGWRWSSEPRNRTHRCPESPEPH